MSLNGALNVGKSALAVHQAAIQVSSNNIANAGNPDYTRQSGRITPNGDQQIRPGQFVGTGINLTAIQRNIDEALESRLRGSISDSELAGTREQMLGRVEAVFNELGDEDLSTKLSTFFNDWSNLANKPQDVGLRQIVLQDGQSLADTFHDVRNGLTSLRTDIDKRIASLADDANGISDQIAELNGKIATAEGGTGGTANGLRDARDALLKQLSGLMNIKTQELGSGVVNVLVGSDPFILGTANRGVELKQETVDGQLVSTLANGADNGTLKVTSGQFGALTALSGEINDVIQKIDDLAGQLIFELNKVHSSGQGTEGYASLTGSNAVGDPAAALNSTEADLDFPPSNGTFVVHVRQKSTGLVTSTLVQVDLDGLNADDTSLDSLAADLDAVGGVTAGVNGGKLSLRTDSSDLEISFSQDTSGVLASLGVNSFFTGSDARDIAINAELKTKPGLLAASKNGERTDNQTALSIAGLESRALSGLGGVSLKDSYETLINTVAVSASSAKTSSLAAAAVQETLTTQREALSGVSLDEEAVNLMKEQRAFQGAARIIAAVDEMMQTLLQLV